VFLQHFRNDLDNLDPQWSMPSPQSARVILLDNRGVVMSDGTAGQHVRP
jgi:hypothetical protein